MCYDDAIEQAGLFECCFLAGIRLLDEVLVFEGDIFKVIVVRVDPSMKHGVHVRFLRYSSKFL